jgi:crotonobetainyl-CoA:carnitine CoA-transferase CaiB-like acyl-CoA transferase
MKLVDVRALDMSSFIPGPYLTLAMADPGAEVIKIKAPGKGDPAREIPAWRTFSRSKPMPAL